MPRIPTAADLGQRPVPTPTGGVPDYGPAGAGVARGAAIIQQEANQVGTGTQTFGKGLSALGLDLGRIEAANARIALSSAASRAKAAMIEAENSFEGDREWQTYEQRFASRTAAAIDPIRQSLPATQREILDASLSDDMQRSLALVRARSRKEGRDQFVAGAEDTLTGNMNALLQAQDESKRASLLGDSLSIINGLRDGNYWTAIEAQKRSQKFATDFAEGRYAVLPPEQRLQALTHGMTQKEGEPPVFQKTNTTLDLVPIEKRVQMIDHAQNQVVAIQREARLEAERARVASDRQLKEYQNTVLNGFIQRLDNPSLPGGPLKFTEVANSPLEPAAKFHLRTVLEQEANRQGNTTNHDIFNGLVGDVLKGRINSANMTDAVLPYLGKGITVQNLENIRALEKSLSNEQDKPLIEGFLKQAQSLITDSTLVQKDAKGDALYYQFFVKALGKIEAAKQAKQPLSDILDPSSKSYIGNLITPYMRSPLQRTQDMADQLRAPPTAIVSPPTPPAAKPSGKPGSATIELTPTPRPLPLPPNDKARLPGETPDDYLKRMGLQ